MKNLGKKFLLTAMATTLVATSVVGLTACNKKAPSSRVANAKEVFSVAAASSASCLTGNKASASALAATEADDFGMDNYNVIKTYLGMFEDMLSGGYTSESEPKVDENGNKIAFTFDGVEYSNQLNVKVGKDACTIYYNETAGEEEVDIEDNEIETETTITGKMVADGVVIDVTGGRKVEKEEDEEESKIWFDFTRKDGAEVRVVQEFEVETEDGVEEQELTYKYEIRMPNEKPIKYELEYESETDKNEMEVKIVQNGMKNKYKVVSKDGKNFKITQKTGNKKVFNVVKDEVAREYEFKFSDNSTKRIPFEAKTNETPVEQAPEVPAV